VINIYRMIITYMLNNMSSVDIVVKVRCIERYLFYVAK